MKTLADIHEDELVKKLLAIVGRGENILVPAGDDCAAAKIKKDLIQLYKTDAVIESIHFHKGEKAKRVGWKAVARVVSDFAAMGGMPQYFLITLAAPPNMPVNYALDLYRGIAKCLKKYGGEVIGGETTKTLVDAPMMLSVAATGTVKKSQLTTRSGASVGDGIFITGKLGGSITGKHLDFMPRQQEALWLTEHFPITAMMDLSDGLAADLPRLAQASHKSFLLDFSSILINQHCTIENALNDGEDYELLFTVKKSTEQKLLTAWKEKFPRLALTKIGSIVPQNTGTTLAGGYSHFSQKKIRKSKFTSLPND